MANFPIQKKACYSITIIHRPAGELEMRKNLSKDFKGGTRMALMRALKWAPTWCVSADFPTFISYPDLIQRLAVKGISGVSPDLSSGDSFRSSHLRHSHGTLENNWVFFCISSSPTGLWPNSSPYFCLTHQFFQQLKILGLTQVIFSLKEISKKG